MSQLDPMKNKTAPDQIYFDVTSSNFQSVTKEPNPFSFNDARTIPFVQRPEDYYLSIIRFTVDTAGVPVFIPSIEPNQGVRDLTIYKVSLGYTDNAAFPPTVYNATRPVIWVPQDQSAQVPLAPSSQSNFLQNNQSGYYNCYSYTWMVYLINLAFSQCLSDLITAITAGGGTPLNPAPDLAVSAPLMGWDSTANRAILYTQNSIYNLGGAGGGVNPNAVNVYMNTALFELFGSFPHRFITYNDPINHQNVRILNVYQEFTNSTYLYLNPPTTNPPNPANAVLFLQTFQEWSTVPSITPIQAIVFTSNTLPIESNQVSTPIVLTDNVNLNFGSGNNSAIQPIVTDLVSETGNYNPNLVYVPPGQYRLITLYGNSPLYNLDIQIYYRLRNGELVPFRLQSGGTVTLKIAFIKK
jgi:hypothetical protein